MNRIYRVIWNCTLQVFQACSELTRRVGKTSTVNLRKSSGLTTKFSRLTLGVLLALSGSVSGASLEVDNGQITNIDTDVAYDAYLVGWYGTGVLNILAGGNASLTTITTSVIGGNEDSEGTVNVLGGTWRLYDSGNNARPLNVGQSGTGTLNIKQKGHVDGGYLRLGTQAAGVGTVNVEGEDSVLTTELFEIGSYGTGSLNITDKGYVTSSIVAILGYQANSNGKVVVEKGGEWLIKNNDSSIEFQIGNQGTGEATIREGGLITAENTIIGGNATGVGTLNVQDQDSVITVRRLYNGYFGNGAVNISNNGLINNKEYSLVGVQDGSHGVVNVTDKGHWNFLGTGEAFRYIYIGDAGDGELNVSREGKVDSGIITAGMKETGTGNLTFNMYVGTSGTGTLTLTNSGTLNVEGGEVYLGVFEPAVGTLNIGAAHGEAAADAGFITNATKVEFGSGEGVFVFNHTNNSDAGYQVDMLITGDDKDGKVIHDAGHTVFNAGNTYSGKTLVNDGLLTIASHTADGVTGMGSSEVTIASPGTLDILASTNSAGDYTLTNALKGDGLMRVQLSSSDKMFGFTHATGTEFAGVAQLKDSTFTLERDNTAALTHAMLQSDIENTTSVNVGEQSIGGLAMNGGTLIFDTDIPAATLAEGYISVDTLVVGASDYTWKGRNYQVNGTGDVLIGVPKPWNDPMANNPLTTLNLLEHDDNHVGVQLVKAQTVIGSGGSLTLRDLQGDEVEADKTLHIAQNGTVVAEGDYGFRLTTAPGDGLYVNYGLKALNIHGGQKLTLAEHGGAYGATADMSAKIGGEGDLAINTVRQVSLSNGQNDYQGATYVQMGTLRTDADGALGNTRELNISNAAIVDLNGSTQTVETFTGQMGSTVLFKEGSLTVNKGGISQGELTGGGNLNVTGGTLAVEGLNARYNALTSVSPNAEVSLDNTQGLGRGNIANDGLLTLKNVTGELRNSISGKGIVSATARTDVELDGDNSRFVGQFNIDTGSALSVNEQKNLGDASVINNGLLTISTERSWAMTHSISGSGDLTKLGTGILTLNNDSSAYQGTTDIVGGEIAFGSDSAINTASQHINIHNSGVMSGNVTTAGDVNVMSGGTLRVAKTTIGESAATWRMAARFK